MKAYICPEGAEFYCEACAPDDAEAYGNGGGEADFPQHCGYCGRFLENPLTGEGVAYVLETMREALRKPRETRNRIMPMLGTAEETLTYYHGSRHVEIVRDWASRISDYRLPERDARFVSRFLSWTER